MILDRKNPDPFIEKVNLFSVDYLKYCQYLLGSGSPREGHELTKKLYTGLVGTSQLLEDCLDFHGAKNNKDWYLYRELSAAVRHLSLGGYSLKHILNRLVCYHLAGDTQKFEEECKFSLNFITSALKKLAPVILDEARRLKIPIPIEGFRTVDFPGIVTPFRLDHDIQDEEKSQQKKNLVKIANDFLNIAQEFDHFEFYEPYVIKKIKEVVPESINEVAVRKYEMIVHNLQSSFDTYVIQGRGSSERHRLRQLRSHFSVVFHLLQMMGRLLHFYERHLHEPGYKDTYKKVRNQLSFHVDPDMLLDRTINFGLYYVCHFLSCGKDVAREILNDNIERSSITLGIPVPRGFHTRPSILVAKIVHHYGGHVELCVNDSRFDASSVLDIQWAGGKIQNENITQVTFEGDSRSLKDIEVLARNNYGEDIMGKNIPLPKELSYLRE